MIVDTSAILAILHDKLERCQFTEAIELADEYLLSTASFVEASLVLESTQGYEGLRDLDFLLAKASVAFVPVDLEQTHVARKTFRNVRKGRHPAKLNFGGCVSYTLAIVNNSPLLFLRAMIFLKQMLFQRCNQLLEFHDFHLLLWPLRHPTCLTVGRALHYCLGFA